MAEHAGFETQKVAGYARGYVYSAFVEEDSSRSNHAWNAVEIEGEHYLVDTTWNAGHVNARDGFIKVYSTDYLFLPPEAFLHTHFPSDASWQRLEVPLSAGEFAALPYLKGSFFTSGLEVLTPLERITEVGSTTRISLSIPEGKAVLAELQSTDGKVFKQGTKLLEHPEGTDVLVIFPEPGEWTLALYMGTASQGSGYRAYRYSLAGRFAFNASEGSPIRFTDGSG